MLRAFGCLCLAGALTQCSYPGRRAMIYYTEVATRLSPNPVRYTLKRSFIEALKNRVTIETSFTVDAVSGGPSPKVFDGDFHFAGRAPEIGLRLVGEIVNAREADSAVALVKRATKGAPLRLAGAWRLWPEHALGAPEVQDRPRAPLKNAYPDHVFEVHPVTRVEDIDLRGTIRAFEGYRPGPARRTFNLYQKARLTIRVTATTVTFDTPPSLFNDVHFLMEITGATQEVVDGGRFVTASARETGGDLLVEGLRMVFIAGTPPERIVRQARTGARFHVWGLPRVNFAEVSRRIRAAGSSRLPVTGPLPYELVILGVFPAAPVP